jgi:hypothetical protein
VQIILSTRRYVSKIVIVRTFLLVVRQCYVGNVCSVGDTVIHHSHNSTVLMSMGVPAFAFAGG